MKRIINSNNEKNDNEIEQPLDPLKEESNDKDLVYLPECSRILWTTSWLFLGTQYTLFITSITTWLLFQVVCF